MVQLGCYCPRALTIGVLPENLPNNLSLAVIDQSTTHLNRPVETWRSLDAIAVAQSTGRLARSNSSFQATMGLLGQLTQKQRRHRTTQADVQFTYPPFRFREDHHTLEVHSLKQSSNVLLVSTKTVQGLRDDDVDAPGKSYLL